MSYPINMGFVAGFLTTVAFVPQVLKVIRDNQTEGISLAMYLIFVTGVVCWVIYGVIIKDTALIIANVVTFSLAFPVLVVVIKNRFCRKKND